MKSRNLVLKFRNYAERNYVGPIAKIQEPFAKPKRQKMHVFNDQSVFQQSYGFMGNHGKSMKPRDPLQESRAIVLFGLL